jgi:hypothetical protein
MLLLPIDFYIVRRSRLGCLCGGRVDVRRTARSHHQDDVTNPQIYAGRANLFF